MNTRFFHICFKSISIVCNIFIAYFARLKSTASYYLQLERKAFSKSYRRVSVRLQTACKMLCVKRVTYIVFSWISRFFRLVRKIIINERAVKCIIHDSQCGWDSYCCTRQTNESTPGVSVCYRLIQ